jgi:SOS response regulatory protein OraA/RecX
MKRATIIKVSEKEYKIMLGNHEIGTSKTDFDGRFHMHAINDALDVAYLEGQEYLERMVMRKRAEVELGCALQEAKVEKDEIDAALEGDEEQKEKQKPDHYQKGGRCRKCGGLTTYTRQNSAKGECFSCEFNQGK